MSGVSGCNSEVSAMRESTVYVREIQACLELRKMLNVSLFKCHCQRKPGRIKRSRSAFDLHLFATDIKAT